MRNFFDLTVEVLDTDGESKQAKLAGLYPYIEEQCAYGIEFDTAISSPVCTRIGNLAFHRTLPVQIKMRGCLLDDNGNVVEYLHPDDWKSHDRSGARGQVMVEIPAHYRRFETDGTKRRVKISELPLPGYHSVPKSYISAYEASLQRSTGKLCSVVNLTADYRGGNNQAWDGTYRSLLGCPVTYMTRSQFRAAARKRGAGTQWNCNVYNVYKDVAWLYYIEYANLNSQALFDARLDINGYRQGGLGNGATILLAAAQWGPFNNYNPFIPCGHTDSFGNASGEVACNVDINGNGSTVVTTYANRYRGIENPFGHIWKWADGINIEVKTDADGGTSKVYVANNPANYVDDGYNNYEMRGFTARTEGYAKEMLFGEFGDIIPALAGGGSTAYWCDYYYSPVTSSSLRAVEFGGGATHGVSAGFGCFTSANTPSYVGFNVGSRLCFIP